MTSFRSFIVLGFILSPIIHSHTPVGECTIVRSLWKTVWQFLKKLNIHLPYDPASPFPGIYQREKKEHAYVETCTQMVTAALFVIYPRRRQLKCSLTEKLMNKLQCICTTDHYLATKRNEVFLPTTLINLRIIMLSQRN